MSYTLTEVEAVKREVLAALPCVHFEELDFGFHLEAYFPPYAGKSVIIFKPGRFEGESEVQLSAGEAIDKLAVLHK